ncbi:hypothetical protein [Roseivirga sp.]|uniref:hypothetical protein n=1 Tax=Roseivirga sp. TaxID=1964215 RepID=UPI002B26CDE2|nr:hypothetical protein [Roseivirga sp.]
MDYIIAAAALFFVSNIAFRVLWTVLDKRCNGELRAKRIGSYNLDSSNVKRIIGQTHDAKLRSQLRLLLFTHWLSGFSFLVMIVAMFIGFFF